MLALSLFTVFSCQTSEKVAPPHPEKNPQSPVMLRGSWVPENPHDIDFDRLPKIKSEHVVVSDVSSVDGVN